MITAKKIAIFCMLCFLPTWFSPVSVAAKDISDRELARAVENRLSADESVDSGLVGVVVREGVVTLSGSTVNLLSKERAVAIAESMRGVRSVINNIAIVMKQRTDDEVRLHVLEALTDDPATEPYEVEVSVGDGQITLRGAVDSEAERKLAEFVAKQVQGVRGVANQITVHASETRPDGEILADLQRRLATNVQIDNRLIDVKVNDGQVFVSGKVGSVAEQNRVGRVAWVAGVKSVDASGLAVSLAARDSLRPRISVPTDYARIEAAVEDAFRYDPRLSNFSIDVAVKASRATLTGEVTSLKAKHVAEQDALNTRGVLFVDNKLRVVPSEPRRDVQLVESVRKAFRRNADLFEQDVDIRAHDGEVQLSGRVSSLFLQRQAAEVASGVNGVLTVMNNLEVEPQKTDREIKYYVVNGLYWDPNITDRDRVTVQVEDGEATLTGTVHNQMARRAAELTARMSGARTVHNRLKVGW